MFTEWYTSNFQVDRDEVEFINRARPETVFDLARFLQQGSPWYPGDEQSWKFGVRFIKNVFSFNRKINFLHTILSNVTIDGRTILSWAESEVDDLVRALRKAASSGKKPKVNREQQAACIELSRKAARFNWERDKAMKAFCAQAVMAACFLDVDWTMQSIDTAVAFSIDGKEWQKYLEEQNKAVLKQKLYCLHTALYFYCQAKRKTPPTRLKAEQAAYQLADAKANGRKYSVMCWHQKSLVRAIDGVMRFGCVAQIAFEGGHVLQFWGKTWGEVHNLIDWMMYSQEAE